MSEYFTNSTYAGKHVLLDLWGCPEEKLVNIPEITECLKGAATKAGATILYDYFHHFGEGYGCTGVIVLSESHISIHTWPESNFASIDIFMCGKCDPEESLSVIQEYFKPKKITPTVQFRGVARS